MKYGDKKTKQNKTQQKKQTNKHAVKLTAETTVLLE
jgi:hypothetical protein